jgi:large subunit ribosomal protein L3
MSSEAQKALGLIGVKCGTSRLFAEDGSSTCVSVIKIDLNVISQKKTLEKDAYTALQLASVEKKKRVNQAEKGHFKDGVPARYIKEVRIDESSQGDYEVGQALDVGVFESVSYVDVSGFTRGKGFAGTVKRYNFKMGDATHGNSKAHRKPGSIGQCQDPGRVFKGKKMAGRMGNKQRTVQKLKVMKVDKERGILLVKGAVPGAPGARLWIKTSIKGFNKRGQS